MNDSNETPRNPWKGSVRRVRSKAHVVVEMSVREAEALADFVKRVQWRQIEENAVDRDEAEAMRDAIERLRLGLKGSGFDPR